MSQTEPNTLPILKELLAEMVADWGIDATEIQPETKLAADLGFSSVDAMQLFAGISTRVRRNLRYDDLVVGPDGVYRSELTVRQIAAYVDAALAEPTGSDQAGG